MTFTRKNLGDITIRQPSGGVGGMTDPYLSRNDWGEGENLLHRSCQAEAEIRDRLPDLYPKYTRGGDLRNGSGFVPGNAHVNGDDERNDTVLALLSPGEVVLPRSVALAMDAPERAAEFMRNVMNGGCAYADQN